MYNGSVDDGGSTSSFASAEEDDTVGSAGNADDGHEDASDEDGEEEYDDLFEASQDIFAITDMAQTLAIDAQPTIAEEDDDEAE